MKEHKRKILYLNQTPWDWILQRSQTLALGLDNKYECTILDHKYLFSSIEDLDNPQPRHLVKVPQLRGAGKIKFLYKFNEWLYSLAVKIRARHYDVIWACYATYGNYIPKGYKGCVIYDCMDNHVALAAEDRKDFIFESEQRLIRRSDIQICSSKKLTEVVPGMESAHVVRNGYVLENVSPVKGAQKRECYTIGYFGAIEHWFDFEKILASAKECLEIEYRLIGPAKAVTALTNPDEFLQQLKQNRVYLEGIIKHDDLCEYVKEYDALIMPFKINDIILAVDPVKLYEYICYGKCVISVWYPEIDRFAPYVYFYHDEEEYIALIKNLIENGFKPKYSAQEQEKFLKENTWNQRSDMVIQIIESHFETKR